MKFLFGTVAAAMFLLFVGCEEKATPSGQARSNASVAASGSSAQAPAATPDAATSVYSPYPTRPQPRLQTVKLWLGTNEITAEVALTSLQIMTGMMWRTNMAEMEGMLFVFGDADQRSFWMKNTLLPLSCAYIDPEGVIQEIYPMEPHNTNGITSRSLNIQYVLEMNRNWFERHGVSTGMVVRSQFGALSETFVRR
ncbi:MAG: DUF192 domain-containing protein [Verrucomicrobiales bacterium]